MSIISPEDALRALVDLGHALGTEAEKCKIVVTPIVFDHLRAASISARNFYRPALPKGETRFCNLRIEVEG